jgi:hypothetical protein
MADVLNYQVSAEQLVELWIQDHKLKRREVRKKDKSNLRVYAILNNSIIKDAIVLRAIRGMQYEGFLG